MKMTPLLLLGLLACGLDPLSGLTDEDSGNDSSDPDEVAGVTVDPAAVDFGQVALGDSSSVDIIIDNSLAEGIAIEDAAITGDAGPFSVEFLFGFPITVQPSSQALATITFSPESDQDYSATIVLAVGEGLVEVPLSGIGGAGGTDGSDGSDGTDGTGDPDGLSISSGSLEFPDTDTNAENTRSLTLTNNGVDDVLVTGIELSDAGSWGWAAAAGESITLAQVISSGNSKTIDVTFSPQDIRAYNDELVIQADGQPDIGVGLSGVGTEPPCTICEPQIVVDTGGSDATIMNFTSVLGFPDARTLIIYNQSDVDLTISNVALTNDTQGGTFALSGFGATTVGPWDSTSGTVTFTCPSICFDIENFLTGENYVTIASNDPDESSYQVGLRSLPE